jgi:hypothetical protein
MRRIDYLLPILFIVITLASCGGGSYTKDEETTETTTETTSYEESQGTAIINIAEKEQQNEMYSPSVDTTHLYWINKKIVLRGATKCNIFALNTLYKAGFKTPTVNALCKDLADTSRFTDIFPVVGIGDPESAKKGDLVVWKGHVIIFESLVKIKKDIYALAWWSGTGQADNGDNIINNVCHGKYKLNGYYVVRRPVKK